MAKSLDVDVQLDFLQNKNVGDTINEFESDWLEFKASTKIKDSIQKTLCAFLNGENTAYLVCGVDDERKVVGVPAFEVDRTKLWMDRLIQNSKIFSDSLLLRPEHLQVYVVNIRNSVDVLIVIQVNPPRGDLDLASSFKIRDKGKNEIYVRFNASTSVYLTDAQWSYEAVREYLNEKEKELLLLTHQNSKLEEMHKQLNRTYRSMEKNYSCLTKTHKQLSSGHASLQRNHETLINIESQCREYALFLMDGSKVTSIPKQMVMI